MSYTQIVATTMLRIDPEKFNRDEMVKKFLEETLPEHDHFGEFKEWSEEEKKKLVDDYVVIDGEIVQISFDTEESNNWSEVQEALVDAFLPQMVGPHAINKGCSIDSREGVDVWINKITPDGSWVDMDLTV